MRAQQLRKKRLYRSPKDRKHNTFSDVSFFGVSGSFFSSLCECV